MPATGTVSTSTLPAWPDRRTRRHPAAAGHRGRRRHRQRRHRSARCRREWNPLLLGAAAHPQRNIVYTGFASSSQVGVVTYDDTGRTTFVGTADDAGAAPCWCVVMPTAGCCTCRRTRRPTRSGCIRSPTPCTRSRSRTCRSAGRGPRRPAGRSSLTSSKSCSTRPAGTCTRSPRRLTRRSRRGTRLHTLTVAADGTLTERTPPVVFSQTDVPANAHPQGLVAIPVAPRRELVHWIPFRERLRRAVRSRGHR